MCTTATIESVEGNTYWARTMDFAANFFENGGELIYLPKEDPHTLLSGEVSAKYDILGMCLPKGYMLTDGINEVGLVGGIFYFEEATCGSQESLTKKNKKSVVLDELVTYFLSSCKTVEEVAYLASQLVVSNQVNPSC